VNKDHSEKTQNEEQKNSGEVSRRDFLVGAGTVVVGGAIGAGLLSGCGETVTTTVKETSTKTVPTTVTVGGGGAVTVTETTTVGGDGAVTVTKTVTEPGGGGGAVPPALEPEESRVYGIGYGVVQRADVKNGKIIRMRPVHYTEDYPDFQTWSLTARGKTWNSPSRSTMSAYYLGSRKRTDSPNRVLYPLKRVDWEPGGDPSKINSQNRGISNYQRISWEEAASIIASEITRIAEKYGTEGIAAWVPAGHEEGHVTGGSMNMPRSFLNYYLMDKYGGTLTDLTVGGHSFAGGLLGGLWTWGYSMGYPPNSWVKDVAENAEMIVIWGGDTETKGGLGGGAHYQGSLYNWFGRELGIKRVFVSPDVNKGVGNHADKWIPLYPSTDGALFLAIAYVWITEDTYDKDYVESHTFGFDLWKDYVMGDEDGQPKTPEWASPICGVPIHTIKALARSWASMNTSTGHGAYGGGASCRTLYAHENMRMEVYLLAMQGWGGPGKQYCNGPGMPAASKTPMTYGVVANSKLQAAMMANTGKTLSEPDPNRQFLPELYLAKAVLDPPVDYYSNAAQWDKRTYPEEGKSVMHFLWKTSGSWTASVQYGHGVQKAFQHPSMECIVGNAIYMEDTFVFADIILPICQSHEMPDIKGESDTVAASLVLQKGVTPRGEAKSDFEAILMVADHLDFADKINEGKDYAQLIQDRIREGYEKSGVAGLVSWEELNEKGYFPQTRVGEWAHTPLNFYNDPLKNPLSTPTGKVEFESQTIKQNAPDDKERLPVAHYIRGGPPEDGWAHNEDRLLSPRAKNYPLLMVCNTSTWKHHSMYSDVPWTREIEKVIGWDGYAYAPVWIHPDDASSRDISGGDIVKVYNERGGVLGGAVISQRIIPGALCFEKAGGGHHIIPGELHQGGNVNSINPKEGHSLRAHGLAPTGYLVEIEKVTGDQMDEWREKYPEAFHRNEHHYDPAYGPFFSGWVEGGVI